MSLDTGSRDGDGRLTSYLTQNVTATSTTLVDSGLEVFLSGNTTYVVDAALTNTANGDGMKFAIQYSGSVETGGFTEIHAISASGSAFSLGAVIVDTQVDQVWHIHGVIRTKSAGRLYVQFAKNTDTTDDTPLIVGSYLAARAVSA